MNLTNIKWWTRPDHYIGETWPDYYVFLGQNRDSDTLARSNFIVGLEELGGESETVIVVRERHWACGWVEWIAIHESDGDALAKADEMARRIDSYPVLSEEHWSELEYSEACDYWENMSVADRMHYCQKYRISIFAARRKELPECDSGELVSALAG